MIVVANKTGALGNRLFVYAHFLAVSAEHGFRLHNPSFDEYVPYFPAVVRNPLCIHPAPRFALRIPAVARRAVYRLWYWAAAVLARSPGRDSRLFDVIRLDWTEPLDLDADAVLRKFESARLVVAQGWLFRAEDSVQRRSAMIREILRPADTFISDAMDVVGRARGEADLIVGVHIRRGDYVWLHDGAYYFELDEYRDLLRRLAAETFGGIDVAFVICSDEPIPEGAVGLEQARILNGRGDEMVDMLTLAGCDYIVGPPSTYTMWASFYGETPLYKLHDIAATPQLSDFEVFTMQGYPSSVRDPGPTYW